MKALLLQVKVNKELANQAFSNAFEIWGPFVFVLIILLVGCGYLVWQLHKTVKYSNEKDKLFLELAESFAKIRMELSYLKDINEKMITFNIHIERLYKEFDSLKNTIDSMEKIYRDYLFKNTK